MCRIDVGISGTGGRVVAKLKTVTLGCKVNQYETQLVREGLLRAGFNDADSTDDQSPADLCVVNTCTVTAEGDSKSRQIIRRLNRENPDARIVVMGCYATRDPNEVAKLPGVSEVVTDKRELPDLMSRFGVIDIPQGISGLAGRHRAWVKVQDGCLLKCTYCIIPTVRPEMYSRPLTEVVEEADRLIDSGFREIVLTGIHLGHYGVDFNRGKPKLDWTRLSHLVQRLVELPGEFRIRLSSIEATEVTRELIAVMKDNPINVCPHLHVCLQSGSDRILSRMRRRWSRRHIIDRCQLIREELDQPAFSTDVIVGFPGETESDFEDTIDACRQIGFSKIHMFPFSPRATTPAADMADQIPKSVKQDRGQQIRALESELRQRYFESLIGRDLQLLVESVDAAAGTIAGTTCRYAPLQVGVYDDIEAANLEGQLLTVRATEPNESSLSGNVK